MALSPINIAPIQERLPIVDEQRRPMASFVRALNKTFRQLVTASNDQSAIVLQLAELAGIVDAQGELITAQQTQIDDLSEGQQSTASQISLANSGVINEAGDFYADFDTMTIHVPNHERVYGDAALNPLVAVFGGGALDISGSTPGDIFYISYSDPTRAGGAVSFIPSGDPESSVQSGNNHYVGTVTVPAAGTQSGTLLRPR